MPSYNLGTASGRIVIDGSGAEKGFSVAESAANAFKNSVNAQIEAVDRLANRLLVIGATGGGAMALMTNSAAAFEQRLSAIKAVSGATTEEMDKISEAALRIGASSKYSATESAAAMEELLKAGLSVSDVLSGAADATVNLAAAGEIALPRAAEIAANAMNNFALTGEDMPRIADLIAGAANASAIDVEQFGMSLSQAGAVASLVGLSFDDTAVAIAEMGNAGIKGSDAGTSLKTMLMNLIPSTEQQINKFKDLGLYTVNSQHALEGLTKLGIKPTTMAFDDVQTALQNYIEESGGFKKGTAKNVKAAQELGGQMGILQNSFFDTEGKVKNLSEIQGILADTTKDMTEEQKLANLEILFGADAIRAAAVLAKEGASGYEEMATAMGKVTAAEVAETRMDNLRGSIEKLSGAWETLSISIGMYFLKPAQRVVDAATWIIDKINALPESFKKAIAMIVGTGVAMATMTGIFLKVIPILVAVLGHMLGLSAIRRVWGIFAGGTAVIAGGGGLNAALAVMALRISALGTWLRTLLSRATVFVRMGVWAARFGAAIAGIATGPVGWVVLILTALAAVGKVLYDKWQPFHDLVDKVAVAIRDYFAPAAVAAKEAWGTFTDGLSGNKSESLTRVAELANTLGLGLSGLVEAFKSGDVTSDGFVGVMERVGHALRTAWDAVVTLGNAFMTNVWPAIQTLGRELGGAFSKAWTEIVRVWNESVLPALKQLWETIKNDVWPALQSLAAALWPIIKVVAKVAYVIVGALLLALFKIAEFIITNVLPVLIQLVGWLLSTWISVFAKVATFMMTYFLTPLIKIVNWILSEGIPGIAAFGVSVWNVFKTIGSFIAGVVSGIIGWFKGLGEGASAGATAVGEGFSGVVAWVVGAWNGIVAVLATVWATITAPFVAVATFLGPFIQGMLTFIGAAFQLAFTVWWSIIQVGWAIITQVFNLAVAIIWGIIVNVGRLIAWAWQSMWDLITTATSTAWGWIVGAFNGAMAMLSAIWDGIARAASVVWNAMWAVISAVAGAIVAGVLVVFRGLQVAWSAVWNAISAVASAIWGRIGGSVTSGVNAIRNTVSSVTSAISSAWSAAWNAMSAAVSAIWSKISSSITSAISNVKGAFDGAGSWLTTAGNNIIQGLINGVKAKATAAVDAVKNIGSSMVSGVKGFLGINSPSRVFEQIGRWTSEGFTVGIEGDADNVLRAIDKMNVAIKSNLFTADNIGSDRPTAYTDSMGDMGSSNVLNYNQTINAPQNMDPDQVATMAARRTAYTLSGGSQKIQKPVMAGTGASL